MATEATTQARMRAGRRGTWAALAALLVLTAIAVGDPGDRDPTYGASGSVLYGQHSSTRFHDVAVHPDGGVVAVGRATYTTAGGGLSPLMVTRHLESGAVDTGWGNQPATHQDGADRRGSFRMVGDSSTTAHAVAVDGQKRILVAATTATPDGDAVLILRLTPAGQLDETYDQDGIAGPLPVGADLRIGGLGVAPGGQASVAVSHGPETSPTSAIFQRNANGTADTGFSGDGLLPLGSNTAVTDLYVDGVGRITYVRANYGGDPQDPTRIHQVRRLTTAGAADTEFNGNGIVNLPETMRYSTAKLFYDRALTVTYVGTASSGSEGSNLRAAQILTTGELVTTYGGDGTGAATAFVPGHAGATARGITVQGNGKVVVAARVNPPGGAAHVALARFATGGNIDSSWRPSAPGGTRHFTVDQLGQPGGSVVDPLAGIVTTAEDKVVTGGFVDSEAGAGADVGFLARYGTTLDPPTVSVTRSYRPFGDPPAVHDFGRSGNVVDFTATASDKEGPIVSYEWSVDGGAFQPGSEQFSPGLSAGEHTITVRVRDQDGQDATASATALMVDPAPPEARIGAAHDTFDPTGLPEQLEEDRVIVFKSIGTDDGRIVKHEWNLDGTPGFEQTGLRVAQKYPTTGDRTIGLRVTDDEGKVTFVQRTLEIVNLPCQANRTVTIGRLKATAACWNKKVEGGVTTWTAHKTPPPPENPPDGLQIVDATPMSFTDDLAAIAAAPLVINGIFVSDFDVFQIFERSGQEPQISFTDARIMTPGGTGTPFTLSDAGSDTWRYDKDTHRIKSVSLARARYGNFDVGELAEDILLPAAGKARLKFYPLLPPELGSVTTDEAVTINTGASAGAASAKARMSRATTLECFGAGNGMIEGIEDIPAGAKICRDPADPDLWAMSVEVDLAKFAGPMFGDDFSVRVDVKIRRDFVSIFGDASFGNGIPLIGPILLKAIDFQVVLNPNADNLAPGLDGHTPRCIPGWGVEHVSNQRVRDMLISRDVPAAVVNATIPDFKLDHGIPRMVACGGLAFVAGASGKELARGDISIGYAEYDDGIRPNAFRAIGRATLLGDPDYKAEVALAVYSTGYADMSARIDLVFFDLVEVHGGVRVQILPAQGLFNAEAWVRGCVIPIDFCSSIKALISNRGIGGCLGLYFLGGEWEPGATYKYSDGLTLYFSGCDLDDVREPFDNVQGTTVITPEFVGGGGRRATASAFKRGPLARSRLMQAEKHEQAIEVEPGLPGMYVAARGQDGRLPRFTLTGPKGERITADGRADGQATEGRNLIVGHDAKTGVSHVLVGAPSAGTWKLVPDQGSPPIANVWFSEGLDKPKIKARVGGSGRERELRYTLTTRKGQEVRFEERGPTGKQHLGKAGGAKGRLRFTSAPGKAEKRQIVAIVSQDGMMRDEQVVATYRAPSTGRPSRVGRALVRRSGTRVVLRWLPASGARDYRVAARLSDGRVLNLNPKGRSVTLKKVPRKVTGSFRILGVNEVGGEGRATKVKLRAPKAKRTRGRRG